ncbi:tautomerase family protein [Lysobacter terrae]
MPLIQCHLATDLSPEQQRTLLSDLVQATSRTLGADPKTIGVIVHRHEPRDIVSFEYVKSDAPATPG